ncbi:MAG: DUF2335 domain-containing protein [bacterium]
MANLSKNFFANISIFPQKFLNKFTQNLKISLHKLLRNKSNKENRGLVAQQITTMEFSGPLPPPSILEKYNQIIPNAAERILVMAEKQSQHRRELEVKVTKADILDGRMGIICGLIIGLAGMVATVLISLYGQPIMGGGNGCWNTCFTGWSICLWIQTEKR